MIDNSDDQDDQFADAHADVEARLNAYRSAIQEGAAYICQWFPPRVIAMLHLDLARYILVNEHGAIGAAERLERAATVCREGANEILQ